MSDVTPVFEFTDESEGDSVDVCRDSKRGLYVACDTLEDRAYASCYITDAVAEAMALAMIRATPQVAPAYVYVTSSERKVEDFFNADNTRDDVVKFALALIRAAREP